MSSLRHAVDVLVPVLLGGITHVAIIKLNWFPRLAAAPVDLGCRWRGRALLGTNKTWRGFVVMPFATGFWNVLYVGLTGAEIALPVAWAWGALLGLGYVLGELPNSIVKRQLDIAPGALRAGAWRPAFWVADQIDSVAGVAIVTAPIAPLSLGVIAWLAGFALVVHPAVAALMVALGLKDRAG